MNRARPGTYQSCFQGRGHWGPWADGQQKGSSLTTQKGRVNSARSTVLPGRSLRDNQIKPNYLQYTYWNIGFHAV